MLSRETGAIVQTSGLISSTVSVNPGPGLQNSQGSITNGRSDVKSTAEVDGGLTRAQEVARMVLALVEAAGGMVSGLDAEDEMKLLRLRTKKNELVIVPGEFLRSRRNSGFCIFGIHVDESQIRNFFSS